MLVYCRKPLNFSKLHQNVPSFCIGHPLLQRFSAQVTISSPDLVPLYLDLNRSHLNQICYKEKGKHLEVPAICTF
jgi:hypothetical protein